MLYVVGFPHGTYTHHGHHGVWLFSCSSDLCQEIGIDLHRIDNPLVFIACALATLANYVLQLNFVHSHVHRIVEHPNQEGDTCICTRTCGLMAESVYGGDIHSIDTDH